MNVHPDQFFRAHHYATFDPSKIYDDSTEVNIERESVREALLWLHGQLWPFILESGMDLHTHWKEIHQVSSTHLIDNFMPKIMSMWVHYGKSKSQILSVQDVTSFYRHARIQVYINNYEVRCWLIYTDVDVYDKKAFLDKLRKDLDFRFSFWIAANNIFDKGYYYCVGDERLDLTEDVTQDEFLNFVRSDKKGLYSGFIKNYAPNDVRISRKNIVQELKQCYKELYPLYEMMAEKINI